MIYPEMNHCVQCGSRLVSRYNVRDGRIIPFCPSCSDFRFPGFSAGVLMVILDKTKEHALMIKQDGDERYYLVAGYIDRGEDAETAAIRETKEEVGLDVVSLEYIRTTYYEPSNTLMIAYTAIVKEGSVTINDEVDEYAWIPVKELKNTDMHELARLTVDSYLK